MAITTKQRKLIADGYGRLYGLNFVRWEHYRESLFKIERDYETRHRRGQYGRAHGMTTNDAAKYFAVKHILDALEKPDRYTVADTLHVKASAIMAQALVAEYKDRISEMMDGFDIEAFSALDYAEMVAEREAAHA